MPRTLEEITHDQADSMTLRGLVSVLNDKLQLRSRYALLEYEAGLEGRHEASELFRSLVRMESAQIDKLITTIAATVRPEAAR
jgi:hypothetical protein